MRYLSLLSITLLSAVPLQAQPETDAITEESTGVTKIQYIQLDQIEKDYNHLFGGQKGVLRLNLVQLRNLVTEETLQGVEVTIETQDRKQKGGSIAFSEIGSLWGESVSATYRLIRDSGYIFLGPERLAEVIEFLDEVIGATNRSHDKLKQWKIALQEGFELGIRYDPAERSTTGTSRPRWKFLVTAKGASYTLDYQDGLDLVRKLEGWENKMSQDSEGDL